MALVTEPLAAASGIACDDVDGDRASCPGLPGSSAPVRVTVAGFVAGVEAVAVPAPHVVATLDGVAMVSAAGSVSVMLALVSATGLGLLSVMVNSETEVSVAPLPCTLAGANTFVPVTFAGVETTSVACADCALVPSDDTTELAGIVVEISVRNGRDHVDRDEARAGNAAVMGGMVAVGEREVPLPGVALTVNPQVLVPIVERVRHDDVRGQVVRDGDAGGRDADSG